MFVHIIVNKRYISRELKREIMEDVRIYDVCLTKEEVLLAKAIIAEKLKKEFTQDVFSLYDNFLIPLRDEQ
jgi:hypothetical protein